MGMRLISLVGQTSAQSSPSVSHYLGLPQALSPKGTSLLPRPDFLVIEETSEGFFLYRYTRHQDFGGDTWHQSLEEAQEQAAFEFGSSLLGWSELASDVEDPIVYGSQANAYTLSIEPAGDLYRGIIDAALPFCSLALVVVQAEITLTESGQRVWESLSPFGEQQVKSSRWPGTELLGAEADLFYCRLEAKSAQLIKSATNRLYGWCHPNLPEDLCLLRHDREPWLVTIAHEQDGFLMLTKLERQHLLLLMPSLRLSAA
jgi:hypothetical protein